MATDDAARGDATRLLTPQSLPVVAVVPAGASAGRRPLLVFLHGKGEDQNLNLGALNLARLDPRRFCAVGGHSAALWVTGGATAAGAFDDAEEFARNDVIGAARAGDRYRGMPVWIDVGTDDPFRVADTDLALALRRHGQVVTFQVWPGSHTGSYWSSHWDSYLRFYAGALG